MADRSYTVAVCGATGTVGRQMVKILEERFFPVGELLLFASSRSVGEKIEFRDDALIVHELDDNSFDGVDIALFSAGGDVSRQYAPKAAEAGAVVIDNTSAFRMDEQVPLVVPEVNPEDIAGYDARRIISNPNCSTIQMVVALKPIDDAVGIERVVVSTYQSVSGAGRSGISELEQQSIGLFNLKEIHTERFAHQIAFNCLPHIDRFEPDGYTFEEHKMVMETRKILHRDQLRVSATCVRVPVFYGHAEAVNVETKKKLTAEQARSLLQKAPGLKIVDDPSHNLYPTQLHTAGHDETLVGRIREDTSTENGLDMWIVADNIRKGAALNAIQIAEILESKYL